jgi:hypothetical protein
MPGVGSLSPEEEAMIRAARAAKASGAPPGTAYSSRRPSRIPYSDRALRRNSAMKLLAGVTGDYASIRPSSEVPGLPAPTADRGQLERDYMEWGYCLVQDALSPAQLGAPYCTRVPLLPLERGKITGSSPADSLSQSFCAVETSKRASQRGRRRGCLTRPRRSTPRGSRWARRPGSRSR